MSPCLTEVTIKEEKLQTLTQRRHEKQHTSNDPFISLHFRTCRERKYNYSQDTEHDRKRREYIAGRPIAVALNNPGVRLTVFTIFKILCVGTITSIWVDALL
mmetsp:Transcript_15731/g.32876  ORF Transcript_15731/g.32876 Transcript_15731/m.32876 type:complete len:102 (-) Transcript_15731:1351-1656(-)